MSHMACLFNSNKSLYQCLSFYFQYIYTLEMKMFISNATVNTVPLWFMFNGVITFFFLECTKNMSRFSINTWLTNKGAQCHALSTDNIKKASFNILLQAAFSSLEPLNTMMLNEITQVPQTCFVFSLSKMKAS